jgi:hypothetical protein
VATGASSLDDMTRWLGRSLLILAIAGLVAAVLPAVRQFRVVNACQEAGGAYDYAQRTCRSGATNLPSGSISWLQKPDGGSLVVALALAIALARLFITLDRRTVSRTDAQTKGRTEPG